MKKDTAMSIYKFRVLLESKEEIFRDIEIKSTQNFFDFHEMIVASYGFDNSQMASFYLSNSDWEKGIRTKKCWKHDDPPNKYEKNVNPA